MDLAVCWPRKAIKFNHSISQPCCFVVVRYWLIFAISIRVTSLALGQSYDCPSASETTLKDMVKYHINLPRIDDTATTKMCEAFQNQNVYELVNLGALKSSLLNKLHIFQCMSKIFCVEYQRVPLKFHTKYLTNTLKDTIFIQGWNFKSSQIYELICVFEMPSGEFFCSFPYFSTFMWSPLFLLHGMIFMIPVDPRHVEFIWYFFYICIVILLSFLSTQMAQVVEILPHGRHGPLLNHPLLQLFRVLLGPFLSDPPTNSDWFSSNGYLLPQPILLFS